MPDTPENTMHPEAQQPEAGQPEAQPPEAQPPEAQQPAARQPEAHDSARMLLISVAGWLVPGLAHLLLRRWGRALVFCAAVSALAVAGLLLRGNVFLPGGDFPFGTLGFLADAGSGVFYLISRSMETVGPDVSRAAGDYGTRLIATAGVLNLLCVLDACEIVRRRKP